MEQPTPTKPVMDVMPPKPTALAPTLPTQDTGPAAHGGPSSANTANASVLPPTDSDSAKLPSASASLEQVGSRTVTGGTGGGAPGAPQPSGEHDGEVSASDRTRMSGSLTVHQAPPLSDEDKAAEPSAETAQQPAQKPTAHTAPPKPHGPAGAITLVILGMVVLSALAILVYLNS